MLALKNFRDKAAGVADLLNWAALFEDGIVQCKDGSFLAGWYFQGPDIQSSTDAERDWLAGRVNAALSRLGAGWATWTEAIRTPAASYPPPELSHFPDPVSRLVDAERRRAVHARRVCISRAATCWWCNTPRRCAARARSRT